MLAAQWHGRLEERRRRIARPVLEGTTLIEFLNALAGVLYILLQAAKWIIIIQAVMSWLVAFNIVNLSNDLVRTIMVALDRMTEPLYRPIRRIMPDLGALDISPMVVLLIIIILEQAILPNLFSALARAVA